MRVAVGILLIGAAMMMLGNALDWCAIPGLRDRNLLPWVAHDVPFWTCLLSLAISGALGFAVLIRRGCIPSRVFALIALAAGVITVALNAYGWSVARGIEVARDRYLEDYYHVVPVGKPVTLTLAPYVALAGGLLVIVGAALLAATVWHRRVLVAQDVAELQAALERGEVPRL